MDRFELATKGKNNRHWEWDLATDRIYFSNRRKSILGSEESMLWNTPDEWFKRIHPEDLEQVQNMIRTHLENGSNQFTIQHRLLNETNSYRWMTCRGVISRNKEGKAIRITGSHSDKTGEKVIDDLTGLPNQILLMDRLTRSLETSRNNSGNLIAVIILDIELPENAVNLLGVADQNLLLVTTSRRLENWLRAAGTISVKRLDHTITRSESGEFIILIDGLKDINEPKKIAERLLKEISVPFEVNGFEVVISASIGIALNASGYQTAEEIVSDAGMALYRSKLLGRGRCEVFDTVMCKSTQADTEKEMASDEHDIVHMTDRCKNPMWTPVNQGLNQTDTKRKNGISNINWALVSIGIATVILFFTVGLLDGFKSLIPAYPIMEKQNQISEEAKTEPNLDTPKTVETKKPLPVYEFPVLHDHFIGSCKGTLKITKNTLSYIPENEKCGFNLSYDEIDFSLDGDRLKIKTVSKNYHFKPQNTSDEGESQSQLEKIFECISQQS